MVTKTETFSPHIPTSRIKDAENRKKDIVKCSLCQGLVWRPVECENCDTTFCSPCIRQFNKNHENLSCPNDCGAYEEKQNPPLTMSLVTKLEIICCYQPNGCTNISRYNDIDEHETNCEYQLKTCIGCEKNIIQKEFTQHYENCGDIRISCSDCSTSYKKKDESLHKGNECLKIQVQQLKEIVNVLQKEIKQNDFWPDFFQTIKEIKDNL